MRWYISVDSKRWETFYRVKAIVAFCNSYFVKWHNKGILKDSWMQWIPCKACQEGKIFNNICIFHEFQFSKFFLLKGQIVKSTQPILGNALWRFILRVAIVTRVAKNDQQWRTNQLSAFRHNKWRRWVPYPWESWKEDCDRVIRRLRVWNYTGA